MGKVSVFPALSGVSGTHGNVNTIRIAAEKRAIEIGDDFNVYTDGSASVWRGRCCDHQEKLNFA